METSGGIRASLAGRYASALFDLARDQRQIEAVGNSLDALGQALVDFRDFAELVASPLVSRDEAGKAFAALAPQLGSTRSPPISSACSRATAANASSQRSSAPSAASPPSIAAKRRPKSSPHALSTTTSLPTSKRQLRARAGSDVTIDATVDPKILGGIVVKLGSQQIDASIRTKLNRLAQARKGEAPMPLLR